MTKEEHYKYVLQRATTILPIIILIIKITISSIVIGLNKLLFFTNSLAKFVIGQFNKPITFKVVI